MNKLGLRWKLMILLAVPVIGLVYFSAAQVLERMKENANAVNVVQLVNLADSASNLVHELQKERGMSSVYVGSQGQRFGGELAAQTPKTDARVVEYVALAGGFNAKQNGLAFDDAFAAVLAKLATLPNWRQRVLALGKDADSAVAEYTAMNALALDLAGRMAAVSDDAQVARLLVAYVNLSRAKERAGIQRALLSTVFSSGSFKGREDAYGLIISHMGAEDAHLRVFLLQTTDTLRQSLQDKMADPGVKQAHAMRQRAMSGLADANLGIGASDWFAAQSRKIDLMRQVEEEASRYLISMSRTISSQARWGIALATAVSTAVILATLLFGLLVVRGIVRSIGAVSSQLASAADQILSASQQVSASSQSLAQGASEQAANLEETSSTLEEIASMTSQNAGRTDAVESKVGRVHEDALKTGAAMARMSERIHRIKDSSDRTAKIIRTIDEIAFQTNLLALNAAVEAARAGDAGRGFAVVAEEVRNLALRSAQAAKDTSALIEESRERADQGVAASTETEALLQGIRTGVDSASGLVRDVAAASKEQARGVQQINEAVSQMDQVTQSNAANAEENAAASEELSAQAHSLTAIVKDLAAIVSGRNGHGLTEARERFQLEAVEPPASIRPAPGNGSARSSGLRARIVSMQADSAQPAQGDPAVPAGQKLEFRDMPE